MDNLPRYYTPTIEEFRVGFEYEFLSLNGYSTQKFEYSSNGYSNSFQDLKEFIKEKSIRVKYLDFKDIEDLGFKITNSSIFKSKDRCVKIEILENHVIKIWDCSKQGAIISSHNIGLVFEGVCKNKSELEYLLRYQLKIIE